MSLSAQGLVAGCHDEIYPSLTLASTRETRPAPSMAVWCS